MQNVNGFLLGLVYANKSELNVGLNLSKIPFVRTIYMKVEC